MKRLVLGLVGVAIVAAAVVGYLFFSGEEEPLATAEKPAELQAAGGSPGAAQGDSSAPQSTPPPIPQASDPQSASSAPDSLTPDSPTPDSPTKDSPSAQASGEQPSAVPADQNNRPQVVARHDQPAGESQDAPAATSGPTFDVVRVEPSGETVIAGRAAPESEVTVTLDEDGTVGTARADRSGAWAIVAEQPLAPGSHEIGIEAKTPEGEKQLSDNLVVVMVPEPKASTAPAPVGAEQPTARSDPPPEAEPDQVLAVLTPRVGGGASKVLPQGPQEGIAAGSLALDSVDYDGTGRAILGGRATPGARMLVYLDNRPIGEAIAGDDGRWVLSPASPILEGLHELRVDEVDSGGTVVARVETPFSRERARPIKAGDDYVIVQPGNSLWRIARRTYGKGLRYTVIYQANAAQIRDPDLIYPGQVFALPGRN